MNEQNEFENKRKNAMFFAGLVYVGVVLAATTLFIAFILNAFPADAYFSRFVMVLAGLMIGASMLAFPVALHNWAVSGRHRTVTTLLYYGEMAIIALNTIVSFGSLLAKNAGIALPEWIALYEPFSIVSIVYTLAAWGTVFQLDPLATAKAKEVKAEQDFRSKVSQKKLEFLDSIEGENAVMAVAQADIAEQFNPARFSKARRHFGGQSNSSAPIPAQAIPADPEMPILPRQYNSETPAPGEPFRTEED